MMMMRWKMVMMMMMRWKMRISIYQCSDTRSVKCQIVLGMATARYHQSSSLSLPIIIINSSLSLSWSLPAGREVRLYERLPGRILPVRYHYHEHNVMIVIPYMSMKMPMIATLMKFSTKKPSIKVIIWCVNSIRRFCSIKHSEFH